MMSSQRSPCRSFPILIGFSNKLRSFFTYPVCLPLTACSRSTSASRPPRVRDPPALLVGHTPYGPSCPTFVSDSSARCTTRHGMRALRNWHAATSRSRAIYAGVVGCHLPAGGSLCRPAGLRTALPCGGLQISGRRTPSCRLYYQRSTLSSLRRACDETIGGGRASDSGCCAVPLGPIAPSLLALYTPNRFRTSDNSGLLWSGLRTYTVGYRFVSGQLTLQSWPFAGSTSPSRSDIFVRRREQPRPQDLSNFYRLRRPSVSRICAAHLARRSRPSLCSSGERRLTQNI